MKRSAQYLSAIAICAVITPTVAWGDASTNGHPKHDHAMKVDEGRSANAQEQKWERDPIVFTARDRNIIRDYYRGASSNLPPGLAKRNGNLPPGLRRHLQQNGVFPPGLQKRMMPLSNDIERRLPALTSGYSRGRIGQDVVIVEDRTQRIMDIIRDVTARP